MAEGLRRVIVVVIVVVIEVVVVLVIVTFAVAVAPAAAVAVFFWELRSHRVLILISSADLHSRQAGEANRPRASSWASANLLWDSVLSSMIRFTEFMVSRLLKVAQSSWSQGGQFKVALSKES